MKRVLKKSLPAALALCGGLAAVTVDAAVVPSGSRVADRSFRSEALEVKELHQALSQVPSLAAGLRQELAELGVGEDSGFYDSRVGRWSSLILSRPLIPGTGARNALRWDGDGAVDDARIGARAWSALRGFLQEHQAQLRVDLSELSADPRIDVFEDGAIVLIHAPRVVGGVPVRDSGLTAAVNHGNLVLLGLRNWADFSLPAGSVGAEAALARVTQHVSPFPAAFGPGRLEVIPTVRDGYYDMRLAWVFQGSVAGDLGTWEGIVDAASGDLLAFEDTNQYAQRTVIGGVYPVSNDQRPPDGLEQPGWPMPFANVVTASGTIFTSHGGTVACTVTGNASTTLVGQFIRINDTCGAINESGTGNLDLGVSTGTDCVVPAGHSVGDTHSARSGFYELNRIKEQARGYLPGNAWLQGVLQSNMNLNNTCNAFWSTAAGTVNFYRDLGSQCRNTGEIAAIFDHEWGHGMDANGTAGGVSSPGEGIADIHAFLRLQTSCIGRGFWKNQVCGGYGDGCIGNTSTGCTGIRDIDYTLRRCNRPHTVTYITQGFTSAQCGGGPAAPACPGGGGTPCGRATHCEGSVVGETAFDLARRDLTAAPFNLDSNTAHELTTRLFMIGSQAVTSWYTCNVGGGCGATGGYLLVLAVDDDNGNLNDGTPHMTAVRAAFERHEIHCATPAAVNSGCAGGPTAAPTLTATPANDAVVLTWTAVANATRYAVYRTEGVSACNFGKIKVAEVAAPTTAYTDTGVLAGRLYSYIVIPMGASNACWGRSSACASATPTTSGACAIVTLSPTALNVDATGNRVLQPNEGAVQVAPTWQNTGTTASPVTGVASNFTGPAGPTYTITDSAADYGTIAAGSSAPCVDCYGVSITSGARPVQHWDTTMLETVAPTSTTKTWALHVGDSFTDVAGTSPFYRFIETLIHKGVTGGCAAGVYCPTATTSREQMAAFVLVAKEGAGYTPPACVPPNLFSDVPETSPFCRFVEELANRLVVTGCGPNLYCPAAPVTREQMAIFVLRTLDPALNPPACTTPMFSDVPASNPFCRWIEELVRRGVVTGCGGGNYCPTDPVTREQMAVFLTVTFGLTLYGV